MLALTGRAAAIYEQWRATGTEFLTPSIDRRAEPPCYLRDPDGYLIEVGQATGLLEGIYAEAQIEEREAAAGLVLLCCACHRLPLRA